DVRHFSYELAWWLWDTFTSQGKPVDLIGHSMGGLIITYALQRVAAQDPLFPPSLTVSTVVTISTPFKGVNGMMCASTNTQCLDLLPGSELVSQVQAAGAVHPGADTTSW